MGTKVPAGWLVCPYLFMVSCHFAFLLSLVCHLLLSLSLSRLAFALYLITMLLFIFVVGTAAWFMLTVGLVMCLASFSYAIIIINDPPIFFPFADTTGELVRLDPHFGWSWYLNLFTGIVVVILASIILAMNYFFPRKIAVVFHHSVVEEDEFFQVYMQK